MTSKHIVLSLVGIAALVGCGKKNPPSTPPTFPQTSTRDSMKCSELNAEDIAKAKNLWDVAELVEEPVQQATLTQDKGIPEKVETLWPNGSKGGFNTSALEAGFRVENDEPVASLYLNQGLLLAEGTIDSRIEKSELRVFARGGVLAISLADMFGKPAQDHPVATESSRHVKKGQVYLARSRNEQLYIVRIDNVTPDSVVVSYRKAAAVSGLNQELHKCAQQAELKNKAEQEFETTVYDPSWNPQNSSLELPVLAPDAEKEITFEGLKIGGEVWTNAWANRDLGPSLSFALESNVIDVGGKPLAQVTVEDFSKVRGGLGSFYRSGGGTVARLKKNRTYLVMIFRQASMNYYAFRITSINPQRRWMKVSTRVVGATAPIAFQKWNRETNPTDTASESETTMWETKTPAPFAPDARFRLCGSLFQIEACPKEWLYERDLAPYPGNYGFYAVTNGADTLWSLSGEMALSLLGKYQPTQPAQRGLYIMMANGYGRRMAYAVEVLAIDTTGAPKLTIRWRKLFEEKVEIMDFGSAPGSEQNWPSPPKRPVEKPVDSSPKTNCEIGLYDTDASQFGPEETQALQARGYSISFMTNSLDDLKKVTVTVNTTDEWFWQKTYSVQLGRAQDNSVRFSYPSRGRTLKEALSRVPMCGESW